ncbi:HCMVUL42, partial [Human betaherpesvirus 5]
RNARWRTRWLSSWLTRPSAALSPPTLARTCRSWFVASAARCCVSAGQTVGSSPTATCYALVTLDISILKVWRRPSCAATSSCLVSSPSPRHTFDMDMMEMPATMHPTTGAYFDNGWKWTFALLVVAILGIIFLAVVFTVVINRDSANITTGTQASSG